MKIFATLISGNSAPMVGNAVDSVSGFVDAICVIDTGITDNTLDVVRSSAGEVPVYIRACKWRDDFAFVRNEALKFATEQGADWAITIDTDERVVLSATEEKRKSVEELLQQSSEHDVIYALDGTQSYSKERIINCKSDCYWIGVTHETLRSNAILKVSNTKALVVYELPKTQKQLVSKFERDLELLEKNMAAEPDNPRWMFYMATTLESLGDMTSSLMWYKKCLSKTSLPALAGWAAFSAARILHKGNNYEESKSICFEGLKLLPASPELLWLWGLNEYSVGRFSEAASLSFFAISLIDGASKIDFRTTSICRDLPAWFELPFDLHSWSLLKLGDEFGSRRYRELADEKRIIRLALLQQVGSIK